MSDGIPGDDYADKTAETSRVGVDPLVSRDDLAALKALALAATQGDWQCGGTPCDNNERALEICAEEVNATTEYGEYFMVVYTPDGKRTALVGHGLRGRDNAEYIAAMQPSMALKLIAALEAALDG
jgi:hypothetical protein